MIAIAIVVGLVVILMMFYVVGLLALPVEITSSSGAITYNNSTGIADNTKVKIGLVMCQTIGALASRIEF